MRKRKFKKIEGWKQNKEAHLREKTEELSHEYFGNPYFYFLLPAFRPCHGILTAEAPCVSTEIGRDAIS